MRGSSAVGRIGGNADPLASAAREGRDWLLDHAAPLWAPAARVKPSLRRSPGEEAGVEDQAGAGYETRVV